LGFRRRFTIGFCASFRLMDLCAGYWRAGDHIDRSVGSGLLVAERQFRKGQGYREIPALLTALANTASKKGVAEDVKVA
jgi:hypothetical protein